MHKIYQLVWGQLCLYVGKTKQTLHRREQMHRWKSNTAHSKFIPDYMDWEMKLLEECADDISTQREQYYYDTLKPWYNHNRPGQTKNETTKAWARRNSDYLREYERQRYLKKKLDSSVRVV